jgi:putative ATP-dependent endonuclease of OLD family
MARIAALRIQNYRSVQGPVTLRFPRDGPLVLLGENNAGKSNIVKGLELLLGGFWPSNHDPEPHEYYGRDPSRKITVAAEFDPADPLGGRYEQIFWRFGPGMDRPEYLGAPGPKGFGTGWIRGEDRDSCVCVVLAAERNLSYQLSYSSKYTLLSRLMHKFHKALLANDATRSELEGLFLSVKDKFKEIPEFSAFTEQLKDRLGDFVSSMTHSLEVDFEAYNPTNFFHALRLQAQADGAARTLEEMGTGEEQILALSFAYAYAQAFHGGIVLVVEEPEAHLHPLAQQWLANRLTAMCEGGLQILITTHSPHLLDILHLDGLVLITKDDEGSKVTQLATADLVASCIKQGAPPDLVTADSVLPFYKAAATSTILEGFFARAVVLVEGPTEQLALPTYFERCGLDHTREGIAILPVHGKGSLARWKRLFTAYGIPVFVVFDNDPGDDGQGIKRKDALRAVGVTDEEHDAIVEARDWIVADGYCVFGTDFETCLRQAFPTYAALEEEARNEGLTAKPLLARWVAERLPDGSDGWGPMEQLAEMVGALPEAPTVDG